MSESNIKTVHGITLVQGALLQAFVWKDMRKTVCGLSKCLTLRTTTQLLNFTLAIAMKSPTRFYRSDEIQRIRRGLVQHGFPRLQMSLLVTLTGASGFLASFILLREGMVEMWLRYLAAFGIAYMVFLVLLWLWLRTKAEDYDDVPDISNFPSSGSGNSIFSGGDGGQFGGGGASGSFDAPDADISPIGEVGSSVGEALGSADELAVPLALVLLVVALIAAIVCSSLFMVYTAPTLFSELLVDGVLSASLYRKLRGLHTRHWLETAIHRTALPFIITAAIVSASGWAMALYAPEAHSIGEVIYHAKHGE